MLLVLGMGTWELSQGRLTLGGLLVFITFLTQLYSPIRSLGQLVNRIYSASAGAERIIEFLDETPAVTEPAVPLRLDARRARSVGLRGVSASPTRGRAAGARATSRFRVEPGRDAGAGRAPAARASPRSPSCCCASTTRSAGRVRLDGTDLRELRLGDLRRNVAVLLQETLVFDGTIRENIAYGRRGRQRGGDRRRGRGRRRARLHLRAAGRLRHPRRAEGAPAVRRPAPADRDRAGDDPRRADPDPRRADHAASTPSRASASWSRCAG